ncbi:acyltransferase family protein [Micromonosporaceae bacterium Da 78-11]
MTPRLGRRRPDDSAAPTRPTTGRLAVIDGLRLVAALAVALYHYTGCNVVKLVWGVPEQQAFPGLYLFTSYGWLGVQMFFLISGFVICMSSWGRSIGDFFRSRVTRLFPAYWPAVLLTTTVLTLWPTIQKPSRFTEVLTNLTMLNIPANVRPVDAVYWTLWVEARFYLLFAVVLLWRPLTLRRTMIFGYAWLVAAVLAVNSGLTVLKTIVQPSYAPYFIGGIALYLIHRFGSDLKLWGLVGLSYVLSAHYVVKRVNSVAENDLKRHLSPAVGVLLVTLFFVVLAVVALGWTARIQWRWLTTAGLLTYPFYLIHQMIGWTLIHWLRPSAPRYVVLAAVLTIMLGAAWLIHRLIEKPLARLLKTKLAEASTAGRQARAVRPDPAPPVLAGEHRLGNR